jgi:hypothetical protein
VESHARITMACFPAGRDRMALSEAFALWAFFTESIYMIIAVTVCSLSRAPAENVTGDVTVAPLPGEQILTVLSTVGVHTADAPVAHAREKSRRDAAENPRNEIMQGPRMEQSCFAATSFQWARGYGWRSSACDRGPDVLQDRRAAGPAGVVPAKLLWADAPGKLLCFFPHPEIWLLFHPEQLEWLALGGSAQFVEGAFLCLGIRGGARSSHFLLC